MSQGGLNVKGLLVIGLIGVGGYYAYKAITEAIGAGPVYAQGGDTVYAKFKWTNGSEWYLAPEFRLDIKRDVPGAAFNKGEFVSSTAVAPGEKSEEIIVSREIPSDWPSALGIPAQVTVDLHLTARIFGENTVVWTAANKIIVT